MRKIAPLICAALLIGCGSPAAARFRCGEKLIISLLPAGGIAINAQQYFPANLPPWARQASVDDKRARLELTQKWAGRDASGNPTSGEYLLVYELALDARILRIARAELPAATIAWQEERHCKTIGEIAFRALEWRAALSLFFN